MKRKSCVIRWLLFLCLMIPSDAHAGLFTTLLSLLSGKAMFGLVVTAMAAYTAYRTVDSNRRFNKVDTAIEMVRTDLAGVQRAVDDRPTKKEVAAHFANTDAKIAACAQAAQVDTQFHQVKTQLETAQLQLTEGFATTVKETAALRNEVADGLKKLGVQVSGVESFTKEELQKVQAALKDDTGNKLKQLAKELDERLANKKDVEAITVQVAAVQAVVQTVNSEMVTQQQLKMMHNDLQKFQAVTLLTMHGLCPIQESMQKLNDLFVQGNGACVFEVIQKHIVDKNQLQAELEKLGITAFAQSVTAGLEAQMQLMVQRQDQIVTKIDAGVAAMCASAGAPAVIRPQQFSASPLPFHKPFTMGIGVTPKVGGAPLYHAVRSSGTASAAASPANATQFLALLPPATS